MAQFRTIATLLLFLVTFTFCNSQGENKKKTTISQADSGKVEVFYFHYTRRCITCNAVESETKNALQLFYPEKMKAGEFSFISLNLDEEEGEAKAKQLEITGQTLLIVKNGKQKNITNEGFMNARSNPQKLHEVIKKTIAEL
jgi:hypothetical protein